MKFYLLPTHINKFTNSNTKIYKWLIWTFSSPLKNHKQTINEIINSINLAIKISHLNGSPSNEELNSWITKLKSTNYNKSKINLIISQINKLNSNTIKTNIYLDLIHKLSSL